MHLRRFAGIFAFETATATTARKWSEGLSGRPQGIFFRFPATAARKQVSGHNYHEYWCSHSGLVFAVGLTVFTNRQVPCQPAQLGMVVCDRLPAITVW